LQAASVFDGKIQPFQQRQSANKVWVSLLWEFSVQIRDYLVLSNFFGSISESNIPTKSNVPSGQAFVGL